MCFGVILHVTLLVKELGKFVIIWWRYGHGFVRI